MKEFPPEMRQLLLYADERGKCSISLVAFAGLCSHSLGNLRGEDGLTMKDLPELKIENEEVSFKAVPTRIVIRRSLSKAGHRYFTFLSS
jgi:hypothetical protein